MNSICKSYIINYKGAHHVGHGHEFVPKPYVTAVFNFLSVCKSQRAPCLDNIGRQTLRSCIIHSGLKIELSLQ